MAEDAPYVPQPASSVEVHLPALPELPTRPVKVGEAYTVWGASYFLRGVVHRAEVSGKEITVEGYIVKTNLLDAPRCAVHQTGRADPENCRAEMPAFWIGDTQNADVRASIKVMGWASNYANIYDAIKLFDGGKPDERYNDVFWGVTLPNPLPAIGAKVRVTGTYGTTFTMASSGMDVDTHMGILTYRSVMELEPAPRLATLPGVTRRAPQP